MAFKKGNKLGKGRPAKAEELKANVIILNALKFIYNKDTDEEAKISFIKDKLVSSQRGQIFLAEHIFGKPKETVETTHNINNFDIKELFKFDKDKE